MERITCDTTGSSRDGHEFRYHLASGLVSPNDVVLDAACGGGYGAEILQAHGDVQYRGVDRDLSALWISPKENRQFIQADLMTWIPNFEFDVFVGFETIEHLPDYFPYIAMSKQAKRWIVVSVPVVPTVGINPWHLHDFVPGQLVSYYEDQNWRLFQSVGQPSEVSEIYLFQRRQERNQ